MADPFVIKDDFAISRTYCYGLQQKSATLKITLFAVGIRIWRECEVSIYSLPSKAH